MIYKNILMHIDKSIIIILGLFILTSCCVFQKEPVLKTWRTYTFDNASKIKIETELSNEEIIKRCLSRLEKWGITVHKRNKDKIITNPFSSSGEITRIQIILKGNGNVILFAEKKSFTLNPGLINWTLVLRGENKIGSPSWESLEMYAGTLKIGSVYYQ